MRRYLWMIGILCLASAIYLYRLNVPSYWLDEVLSLQMSRDWDLLWQRLLEREANMWLYYIQLHFWQQGSQIEFYTRWISVAFALLSVALVYALVCRLFKQHQAALMTALVLGLNPFMVRYAQESRGYSETLFFGLLASYCLVRGQEAGRWGWWLAYGLAIIVGMYLHLFIAFLVCVHGLWLLSLKDKQWKNYLIAGCIAGLGILSVLILQPIFSNPQVDWIPPFEIKQLRDFGGELTGESIILKILYGSAGVLAIVYFIKRRGEASQRLIWLYFLVPIGLAALISLLKPLFVSRYLLIVLPALASIVGLGAAQLPKRWLIGVFAALVLIASLRSNYYALEIRLKKPHYSIREVASYLDTASSPEDLIMVQAGHTRPEVIDYYQWRYSLEAALQFYDERPELSAQTYPHIWLLQVARRPVDETVISAEYHLVGSYTFNGLKLWEYELNRAAGN